MSTIRLIDQVSRCDLCAPHLPHGVRPVLQWHPQARVLIAGQAPGRRVHASGVPFDDASGDRLRDWMGLDRASFYDPRQVAILPMSFCYPGSGRSGDLPPRPECAPAWRQPLLDGLKELRLTLLVGQYAQSWHLGDDRLTLTARVEAWRQADPAHLPLPHPSPRNRPWLQRHPWFEQELLPVLRQRVAAALA